MRTRQSTWRSQRVGPKALCDITKSWIPGLCFSVDLSAQVPMKEVKEKVFSFLTSVLTDEISAAWCGTSNIISDVSLCVLKCQCKTIIRITCRGEETWHLKLHVVPKLQIKCCQKKIERVPFFLQGPGARCGTTSAGLPAARHGAVSAESVWAVYQGNGHR